MKKISGMKALGLVTTIVSVGISLLSSYVSEKQLDAKLDEKVQKAFAQRNKKRE